MVADNTALSNLQLELIKLYSFNVEENDLLQIKKLLGKYFAYKAISEADKIWDQNNYTNELMDKWIKE
jgi:hypothetical protein